MLKMLKQKIDINSIFLFLICLSPFFDTLNGIFRELKLNIPVTAPFRILAVFVGLYLIFKYSTKDFLLSIISLGIMSVSAIFHILVFKEGIYESLYNVIQWNYFVILFLALKNIFSYSKVRNESGSWLNIFTVTSLSCYLIPYILGLGNYTYASTKNGYKAFFIATNSVSFMYISLFFANIYVLTKKLKLEYLIKVGLLALCLLLIGTKACLLFMLLGVMIIGIRFLKSEVDTPIKLLVLFGGIVLCMGALFVYKDSLIASVNRMIIMYNKSDNIFDFLSSSRLERIPKYVYSFTNDNVIVKNLFGIGKSLYPDLNIVEMDYFDLYFQYGLIGFITMIFMQYYIFSNIIKIEKKSVFVVFLIVVYGFVVGHVFTNALSSTIAALTLTYMQIEKKNKQELILKEVNYDFVQINV